MEENVIHLNQMDKDVFIKPLTARQRADIIMKWKDDEVKELRRMLRNKGIMFIDLASDAAVDKMARTKLTLQQRDAATTASIHGLTAHIVMTNALDPATLKPIFASIEEVRNAPAVDAARIVKAVFESSGFGMDV